MAILLINNFNGGLSSGEKIGLSGSFRFGSGINIHSNPDVLKVSPKSTKDSGTVVVDLPMFSTTNTVNSNIYFLGDAGKLYCKSSGVYSVLNTYTNAQGMGFFTGTNKVVFCSGDKEYKIDPSTNSISTGRTLDSADFHPVEAFLDKVFVGNGRELISTDGSAIDYNSSTVGGGLTVEFGQKIKCLKNIGDWLFIGCVSDNSSLAAYYLWDGVSEDANYLKKLKGEDGVNSCDVSDDGTVIISAGKKGHLYQLTGLDTTLNNIKTIPLIEIDKTIEVYPGAMTNYQGRLMVGLSDGTSLTAERGVYSWASHSNQYSKTLNLEYKISTGTTTGTTTQVGLVYSANTTDLYMGWADNGVYGIDKIDGSGVQGTAVYQSLIHDAGKPFKRKHYKNFKITLAKALASGETIELSYKKDRGSWASIGTMDFAVDGAILEKNFKPDIKARELEIQLEFTNTGSTGAEIDSIAIIYEEEDLI